MSLDRIPLEASLVSASVLGNATLFFFFLSLSLSLNPGKWLLN